MSAPTLATSAGLRFYREVCRCVPMLVEQFDLGEVTDKHKLRRVVAGRFQGQKGLTNADSVEMLIHKGRQELVEYMERYKTRNHLVNEWVYDVNERQRKVHANRGFSPFMEKFLESNYNKPGIA